MSVRIRMGFWNMLADGLSLGEFMSPELKESVGIWTERRVNVCQTIADMFCKHQLDLVALVENDRIDDICKMLNEHSHLRNDIGMVHVIKGTYQGTNAYKYGSDDCRGQRKWGFSSKKDMQDCIEAEIAAYNKDLRDLKFEKLQQLVSDKNDLTSRAAMEEYLVKKKKSELQDQLKDQYYDSGKYKGMFSSRDEYKGALDKLKEHEARDDHLTIMYRKSRLVHVNKPSEDKDATGMKDYHTWTFKSTYLLGEPQEFKVTVAHLPSGEDNKGAVKRMTALKEMMEDGDVKKGSFILMDSNFSCHYPDGTGVASEKGEQKHRDDFGQKQKDYKVRTGVDIFEKAGYVDVVPDVGQECFKMRHARGGQPKKFCEFMFDRIDRILVPAEHSAMFLRVHDRMDPTTYKRLREIRAVKSEREKLKTECKDGKWYVPPEKYDYLQGLYPNKSLPSDHPPVAAVVWMTPPTMVSSCYDPADRDLGQKRA